MVRRQIGSSQVSLSEEWNRLWEAERRVLGTSGGWDGNAGDLVTGTWKAQERRRFKSRSVVTGRGDWAWRRRERLRM